MTSENDDTDPEDLGFQFLSLRETYSKLSEKLIETGSDSGGSTLSDLDLRGFVLLSINDDETASRVSVEMAETIVHQVVEFLTTTGTDSTARAAYFLEMSDGNVNDAVNLYLQLLNEDSLPVLEETETAPTAGSKDKEEATEEKCVSDLTDFSPPRHLIHSPPGGFPEARFAAEDQRRWLLVNLQKRSVFSCDALNAHVWRNDVVEHLIRADFVFWQDVDESLTGKAYAEAYQVHLFPHIAIIDPRSTEILWCKEGWTEDEPLTAAKFAQQLVDFCSLNPYGKRRIAKPGLLRPLKRPRQAPTKTTTKSPALPRTCQDENEHDKKPSAILPVRLLNRPLSLEALQERAHLLGFELLFSPPPQVAKDMQHELFQLECQIRIEREALEYFDGIGDPPSPPPFYEAMADGPSSKSNNEKAAVGGKATWATAESSIRKLQKELQLATGNLVWTIQNQIQLMKELQLSLPTASDLARELAWHSTQRLDALQLTAGNREQVEGTKRQLIAEYSLLKSLGFKVDPSIEEMVLMETVCRKEAFCSDMTVNRDINEITIPAISTSTDANKPGSSSVGVSATPARLGEVSDHKAVDSSTADEITVSDIQGVFSLVRTKSSTATAVRPDAENNDFAWVDPPSPPETVSWFAGDPAEKGPPAPLKMNRLLAPSDSPAESEVLDANDNGGGVRPSADYVTRNLFCLASNPNHESNQEGGSSEDDDSFCMVDFKF